MKKFIFFAAIIGFSVATLCSCGSKSTSSEDEITVTEITVTGSDGKVYTNYREACRNCDFDAAYSILEKKREKFEKYKEEDSNDLDVDEMVKNYEDGMNYVFNAEMLYLTSQNTEEASNRILYLLAESEIPGTPTTAGGQYNSDRDYENAKKYIEGIARFNNRCNSVLDMAIAQKNEKLANGVVKLMKQNVDVEKESTGLRTLSVSSKGVNNTDIDLAKKKLDDAIKSGAFK